MNHLLVFEMADDSHEMSRQVFSEKKKKKKKKADDSHEMSRLVFSEKKQQKTNCRLLQL